MRLELEELESRALLSASGATPDAATSAPASSAPGTVQPLLNTMPQQTSGTIPGYSPKAIQQAYGVSPLLTGGTNGSGETIAIVDASYDPNIISDLQAFDQQFGLANPNLQVVTSNGTPVSSLSNPAATLGEDANWAAETALDVEWAHSIAPGANILLVEAPLDSTNAQQLTDLLNGVSYAASSTGGGANVVSMSWGVSEFADETKFDSVFTQNPNVTFVAASGDNSAFFGPIWPATSPYVLAVGGTSLSTTTSGGTTTYKSESGWFGSGGGFAGLEGEPNFQVSAVGNYDARLTPDVAFDANPSTGVAIYDSFETSNPWIEVGGTSVGSPVWAGIVALADQQYQKTNPGSPTLGTYQVESTLYSVLHSSNYTSNFHDITRGYNGYFAGRGYDLVTGLGSPVVNHIVPLLANPTVAAGQPAISGSGTGFFSSSTSGFKSLASAGHGVGLFVTTGSPTITAASQAASGFGAAPVGMPFVIPPMASVPAPLGTSAVGALPASPIAANNNVLVSFNLAEQGSAPALVNTSGNLSGPSNAAAPPSATVFGASGWNGTSNSMLLNSHGLHGPTVDEVVDDLAGPLLEEVADQPHAPILDGGDGSGADAPALDAAPVVDDGTAGDGSE